MLLSMNLSRKSISKHHHQKLIGGINIKRSQYKTIRTDKVKFPRNQYIRSSILYSTLDCLKINHFTKACWYELMGWQELHTHHDLGTSLSLINGRLIKCGEDNETLLKCQEPGWGPSWDLQHPSRSGVGNFFLIKRAISPPTPQKIVWSSKKITLVNV